MHPVTYLFEDIYRNYWGITPAAKDRKEPVPGHALATFRGRAPPLNPQRRHGPYCSRRLLGGSGL